MPLPALAGCQVQTLELPVKMIGTRAVATVGINGTSIPLTVDSGAFYSFLTTAAAEQLKLTTRRADGLRVEGLTGRVETRGTKVDKLQLLGGDVPNVDFIVGGNEPGAGTMGLMGRNLLSFTDTEYDLAHGVIRFHFPNDDCAKANMAYWAGTTPVTVLDLETDYHTRSKTPSIRTKIKLNGRELVALFDTGATTMVTTSAAARAGVGEADLKAAGIVYGAGRGRAKAYTGAFAKFEIGGEAISNNTLHVADFDAGDADLLLGIDFFLAHRIYISKGQSKMYLTYGGGPVFTLDRTEVAARSSSKADAADPTDAGIPPATADELARRAAASAARRDYNAALADLDRACALAPSTAALFAQRGGIQQAMRRPAKALEDYDRALQLDPDQIEARFGRVALRSAAKDRDGAKSDLDVLDRTLPPQAQLRVSMASVYLALDQPARAVAQLDQWLPTHSTEVGREVALNNRCWARVQMGVELDKALDDCDDAIGIDAGNATFLDSRGWVYLRMGKDRKALSDFDRSVEVRPQNAFALYGRGLAKRRLGDAAAADADLAAARKVTPEIETRLAHIGLIPTTAPKP